MELTLFQIDSKSVKYLEAMGTFVVAALYLIKHLESMAATKVFDDTIVIQQAIEQQLKLI